MESGIRDRGIRKTATFPIETINFNVASVGASVSAVEQDVQIMPFGGVVIAIQGYSVGITGTAQWEVRKNGTTLSLQSALVTQTAGNVLGATLVTTGPGYVNIPAGTDSSVNSDRLTNPNNAPTFAVGDRLSLYVTTAAASSFTQLSVCLALRPYLGSMERTQAGIFN